MPQASPFAILPAALAVAFSLLTPPSSSSASAQEPPRLDAPGTPAAAGREYRRALLLLTRGSREEARQVILELDGRLPPALTDRRAANERLDLLEDVARRDPEALLPALLLHLDLYLHHRDQRSYTRLDHHVEMVARTAELYAGRSEREDAPAAAAEVLAALGLGLLEAGHRTDARRLLARALDLDPGRADALLGLATDHERFGRYDEAVETLERLLAAAPGSSEARLRLAVNRSRTGRWRDAESGLEGLIDDPRTDPWVAEIAVQELAEVRLRASDPGAATRLLREGVRRFPGSERLRLQLAYALERGGDPAAAREIVLALAERPPEPAETPRQRYNRSPDAAPALDRLISAPLDPGRLAALRAALDAIAAEELP